MITNHLTLLKVILLLLSLMTFEQKIHSQTQDTTDLTLLPVSPENSRHAIAIEGLGRTFFLGSVNYEYAILPNVSIGLGLGISNLNTGEITRVNDGAAETGRYLDLVGAPLFYCNYYIGKNNHHLLLTAGLTGFTSYERRNYPTEVESFVDGQVEWNAGIGYQYTFKRFFGRITGYCISMPDPHGWFPKYMPWAGLTVGYRL